MEGKVKKRLLVIIASIVLGAGAVFLVNCYIKERERKFLVGMDLRPVLVAVQEIPKRAIIRPDMVRVIGFPSRFIQPQAINSPERAVGLMTLAPIMPNEQILSTKLSPPERPEKMVVSLAMKIPPGRRAVTIEVDSISAARGLIRPGDYVDILGTFVLKKEPVTAILFQNVLVLAVEGEMVTGAARRGEVSIVTLALTPEEAGFITMAAKITQICLVLRAKADKKIETIPVVDREAFFKQFLPPPEVEEMVPLEEGPTVEVFRGLKKEIEPLPTAK